MTGPTATPPSLRSRVPSIFASALAMFRVNFAARSVSTFILDAGCQRSYRSSRAQRGRPKPRPKTRPDSGLSNPPARGRIDLRLLCSSSPGGHVRFDQLRKWGKWQCGPAPPLAVTYRGLGDMPRSGLFVCGHVSQYAL
jgi:hypothetical protein